MCCVVLWCLTGRLTVVLCPLTALCRQHERYLLSCGVPAASLSAGTPPAVREAVLDCIRRGTLVVLIVSPEQLIYNERLLDALISRGVALLVFDEAHTWLSWPTWRPAMLHASARLPPSPRLAMTATLRSDAEPRLLRTLGMVGAVVSRHPFFRANLCLRVEHRPSLLLPAADGSAPRIVQNEEDYRVRRALHLGVDAARLGGNGIIYVRLRRDADYLAGRLHASYTAMPELHDAGAVFFPYHAGREDRRTVEQAFAARRGVIVVATVAFGLGINSSAVRIIVHMVRATSCTFHCLYRTLSLFTFRVFAVICSPVSLFLASVAPFQILTRLFRRRLPPLTCTRNKLVDPAAMAMSHIAIYFTTHWTCPPCVALLFRGLYRLRTCRLAVVF